MNRGTVKWFSELKGFGFICDNQGNNVFVHYSGIQSDGFKTLYEGQTVEYEIIDTEKGRQAINARVVSEKECVETAWDTILSRLRDVKSKNIDDEITSDGAD